MSERRLQNRARLFALSCAAMGGGLLGWCIWFHYCVCGHLNHAAYGWETLWVDYGWRLGFLLALLSAVFSNMKSRPLFYSLVVLCLCGSRWGGVLLGTPAIMALELFCLLSVDREQLHEA